jgi:hypothetical protein
MLTSLIETTFSDSHSVDREAGVIRSVRVLGRSSRNGREYSERALGEAARLYEGLGVNLNHADRRETTLERPLERAVEAGFGWLEAIEVRADGIYGDLHFLKTHPHSAMIVEAAERNPRRFGLSHHAEGRVVRNGQKNVVESIERVRSVDMVQNPATNAGLFESEENQMHKTIRQILSEAHGGRLAALLQDPLFEQRALADRADAGLDLPADAGEDDQVAGAFKSMIDAVLDDDSLDLKSRLAKIRDILKAQEKLTGSPSPAADSHTPTVAESAREAPSSDPLVRQLVERLERVETEADCRALLEARNRACDATRLKTLALLNSEDERVRLIESWPERAGSHLSGLHPRPNISRPLVESESVPLPKDARALALALR